MQVGNTEKTPDKLKGLMQKYDLFFALAGLYLCMSGGMYIIICIISYFGLGYWHWIGF